MKNIIFIITIVLLVSCSKFLDEPIRGVQTIDNYFTTEQECINFMVGCYQGMFQDDWWQIQFVYLLMETSTDDAWLSNPTQSELDYKQFSTFQVSASNDYLYPFWEYMYKNIFNCNLAIEGLTDSEVNYSNPELIQRLIAEAKFIRAYSYFELVKNFKEMPLLTKTMTPDELTGVGLSTQQEVYEQIISDFSDAAKILPHKYENVDLGRATKGATWGFLSRAFLYTKQWKQSKI